MTELSPSDSIGPDAVFTAEEWEIEQERAALKAMFDKPWPDSLPGKPV